MRAMRLVARSAVCVAVAAVLIAVAGAPAGAAELADSGWWWRANTGETVDGVGPAPDVGLPGTAPAPPPPPDVPDGGLFVARDPDGAHAIGAVRFALGSDETNPVLTLAVADGNGAGEGDLLACPTASAWVGEEGGRWDSRPLADCDAAFGGASVAGVPAEDGSAWTFDLAGLARDAGGSREVDVAIVPFVDADAPVGAHAPFELRFEKVDAAALAVDVTVADVVAPPESSAAVTKDPLTAVPPPLAPAPVFEEELPAPAAPAFGPEPVAPSVDLAEPVAPAPTRRQVALPEVRPAVPASIDDTTAQTTAAAVLFAGAVVLYLAARQRVPLLRRLARLGARGGAAGTPPAELPIGGLGRFARPRHDAPPRL